MPFKSDKQRKYLFAKKPDVAKKLAHKYRYGGHVGAGESVAGTSAEGTENRHVFKEGGMAKDKKKSLFDFLKNVNVKKLEEKGYDRYGRKQKRIEKKDKVRALPKKKLKDGGIIKNPCGNFSKIEKLMKKNK